MLLGTCLTVALGLPDSSARCWCLDTRFPSPLGAVTRAGFAGHAKRQVENPKVSGSRSESLRMDGVSHYGPVPLFPAFARRYMSVNAGSAIAWSPAKTRHYPRFVPDLEGL